MKLRTIAEGDIKGSDEVIRKSAEALGDLVQFAYENLDPRESKELAMLDMFLKKPTPRSWERTKWVIDSLMEQSVNDPELQARAKGWAGLKGLTSPVIAASVYDIDPSKVADTPLSDIALSKQLRDKLKETLGPEGYVSSLADMGGKVDDRRIKELLKSTAKSGEALTAAAEEDMPGQVRDKPVKKF